MGGGGERKDNAWAHLHIVRGRQKWKPERIRKRGSRGFLEYWPEIFRVLNDAVSKFDTDAAALFEGLFQKQRLQQWVQLFTNIFK